MPGIIALALIAIVALTILTFTVHFLFSPWLLVVIAHPGLDQVPPAPFPAVATVHGRRCPAGPEQARRAHVRVAGVVQRLPPMRSIRDCLDNPYLAQK